MFSSLIKTIRNAPYSKKSILSLANMLPAEDDQLRQLIEAIVADRDDAAFLRVLYAAFAAGREVDASHLLDGLALLRHMEDICALIPRFSGDVVTAVTQGSERRTLRYEPQVSAILATAAWCSEHKETAVPGSFLGLARTLARKSQRQGMVRLHLLVALDYVWDDALASILKAEEENPLRDEAKKVVKKDFMDNLREDLLLYVPEEVEESTMTVLSDGHSTIRRPAPRVGRNEPCPCGSGKKYKKCCMAKDEERLKDPSDIAGVTHEELMASLEQYATLERLNRMTASELVRLDPMKMPADLLPSLVACLREAEEFDRAVWVLETVGIQGELGEWWLDSIDEAMFTKRKDLLERLLKLGPVSETEDDITFSCPKLALAVPGENPAFERVESLILKSLAQDQDSKLVDLASVMLSSPFPALGILVARAMVCAAPSWDAESLLQALLKTRDHLGLPPFDEVEEVFDLRFSEQAEKFRDVSEHLAKALDEMTAKRSEIQGLKIELTQLESRLKKKERVVTPAESPGHKATKEDKAESRPQDIAELKSRIASMKEIIQQRHAERNALRMELSRSQKDVETLRQERDQLRASQEASSPKDAEPLFLQEEDLGTQPIRVPHLAEAFLESLSRAPHHVAKATLRLIGRLAAGDDSAYQGCKRLKMDREVLRQRIADDYRLLFRFNDDALDILRLTPRKDLEREVKSLTGRGR